jgi:hypothetical protein
MAHVAHCVRNIGNCGKFAMAEKELFHEKKSPMQVNLIKISAESSRPCHGAHCQATGCAMQVCNKSNLLINSSREQDAP